VSALKIGRSQLLLRSILIGGGSGLWTTLSSVARFLSFIGLVKVKKLNSRVISVGNLQAGGTGKTPLVAQIANEAAELGLTVCILIRGYKGLWEAKGGILFPDASISTATDCGDEAALLHDLCPKAYIGVGALRYRQYQKILAQVQKPMDLVILDDGFQNLRIQKDLEVVALTSAKPWQVLFRDRASWVKKANLVIWTKGYEEPNTYGLPRVRVRYQLAPVQDISVWLVTGVADEESVYLSALRAGYRITKRIPFEDHARYGCEAVRKMLVQAQIDQCRIAITGKDWVKWRELGVLRSEVVVLELNLVFEEGRELWSQKLWGHSVS
jgi:tetraacyldisaccharide 4'-kinase